MVTMMAQLERPALSRSFRIQAALEKRHGSNASKVMAKLRALGSVVPTDRLDSDNLRRDLNLPHTSGKHVAAVERLRSIVKNRLEQAIILRHSGLNEDAMDIEDDVENRWQTLLRKAEARL